MLRLRLQIARTFLARIEGLVAHEDLGERDLKGIPKPVAVHNLTQLKRGLWSTPAEAELLPAARAK